MTHAEQAAEAKSAGAGFTVSPHLNYKQAEATVGSELGILGISTARK
jgi:2-keto-3-deoxy-6-phosphogluconate aldolase